jgi:ABC-2 type transport system ATP-binding protein
VSEPLTIETIDLQKRYDTVAALRGLDLQVPAGSIFGFLGRNGAGKTTTIKILLGMARASGGEARVFGQPTHPDEAGVNLRRRIGFVSDDKDLFDYMTVGEMIRFTRSFYPRWREELERRYLTLFELPLERKVKVLSRGMRTKLALLLALCRGADLLVLDEPTAGLDPAVTEEVLQALVSHVAAHEMTVFFSSHQIAEVDQIADRIAIIHRGRTVMAGALDELRASVRRVQLVFDGDAPEPVFRTPAVMRTWRKGRVLTVLSKGGAEPVLEEARALNPVSIDVVPVTLKELFLETVAAED